MKRAGLPLVALALLAEVALFRLEPDASPAFALPIHALAVLAAALVAPRIGAGRRALAILLLFTGAGLGLLELGSILSRRARPEDAATVQVTVERDADAALAAFGSLLARERDTVQSLPLDLLDSGAGRPELFARLEEVGRAPRHTGAATGITIFAPGGEALAWAGESSLSGASLQRLPPSSNTSQFISKGSLRTSLVTVRPGAGAGARTAVLELLLDSPSDPAAWRKLVAITARMRSELAVEFLDPDEADAALGEFLEPHGDRYWKRGSGVGQLLAAWRDGSGEILGLVTLSPEPAAAAAAREAHGRELPRQGLLLTALFAAILFALRLTRRSGLAPLDLATLALLLPALRLACGNVSSFVGAAPLFDYRLFSAPLPFGLAASPGDCLLSCLTVLGLAGIAAAAVRGGGRWARAFGVVAAMSLAVAAALLTSPWVTNSTLNPAHVPVLPPEAPHIALAWGHASLAFAAALLAFAALSRRERLLSLRWAAALLVAAGALSHLLLVRESAKVPVSLIESSLAPEVLRAKSAARERVLEFLAHASSSAPWLAVASAAEGGRDRLTFEAWRESDLGRAGARSAVAVMDSRGRILSSFAYGLPDSVFEDTSGQGTAAPSAGGAAISPSAGPVVSEKLLRVVGLEVPLLGGEQALLGGRAPAGRIAVLLSTEWDNLPFLTLGDPLLRSLGIRSVEPAYDESFGGAPLFVAYSPTGEVLFPPAEQVAPLGPALVRAGAPLWTETRFGGTEYRTYLFPTPDGPRAIGYAAPSTVAIVAGFLRASIVQVPLIILILLFAAYLRTADLGRAFSFDAWARLLTASYSRRLQAIVLAGSLVPLVLLAVIFRDTIEQRTREAVAQAGVQSAATVRRLLEDYVKSEATRPGDSVWIGSRTLFWVARTVHQDVHLFVGQQLMATSRGDPEASGLRAFRLDAAVARTLALSRPPQILSEEPLPGGKTALVYAPVRLKPGAPEGILALPLLVQERDLTRGGEAIADALLVATFGLGVVLSGVGYLFARRLSVPIRDLARAARTIAGGQLGVRVTPRGKDEIRQLIDAFNTMAAALVEQREDLRRRKDYIEAILLNVTTGVISTDRDGVVRTSNPAASLVLDLPIDLVGRNLFDELHGRSDLAPLRELWSAGPSGALIGAPREIPVHREAGEMRLRSVVLPLAGSDSGAPGSIYLVEDVTEVMRSNRLAAWAEMARRIAHEIKNPLTPIQLSAEHLMRVRSDGGEDYDRVLRQCVETILGQVRALREISSEFSAYARLPDLRREPEDMGAMLGSTLVPYAANPPAGVSIHERIDTVPRVSADPRVLKRAFVNLIENALQAMEGGGVLTVSLRRVTGAEGDRAEIVFEDTGEGMDEEIRTRIFEPYFSTRDGGTGLGLAIAKRAVEEHGGTLEAESAPGRGTRMILRLPLESASPAAGETEKAAPDPASAPKNTKSQREPS